MRHSLPDPKVGEASLRPMPAANRKVSKPWPPIVTKTK